MQIGVVFPQTEIESDVGAIRAYAQGAETLGYAHLMAYEHVVGADPVVHSPWDGPYDVTSTFQELFVLYGYLAAATSLELVTGVLVLPQRQTTLVAKQAAQVDQLTNGRFRLGVGVGWNTVEYQALGKEFGNRGKRIEEQIPLLRRLWTEDSVTFDGTYERVVGAGINPLPVQRPIPIWMGGRSNPAYHRMGRLADGWIPEMEPGPDLDHARAEVAHAAARAGRDPSSLGMHGRVLWSDDLPSLLSGIETWRAAGATHLAVNTMKARLGGVDEQLRALARLSAELELA